MRILQLSTHTTVMPRHGGQLRSHHIGRVLEEAGFELRRIAFAHRAPDHLDDPREPLVNIGRSPFWSSAEFRAYGRCGWLVSDYLCGICGPESPDVAEEFDRLVRAAAPDVILMEHPWTWPLLARLEEVRSGAVPLVYSSQNVEIALKRRILAEEAVAPSADLAERLFSGIEALERGLVEHAAGVGACTAGDAEAFAAWGARRVVVAPNGGVRHDRDHLIDILPAPLLPGHVFALVVGSAHPPNVSGFLDLVLPVLPRLLPHQRIVVAGDAGLGILQAMAERGLSALADGRLVALGRVEPLVLDCLIANAQVILVPILYGGGSNVKTAEALLAGRRMVVTEAAMRGFEDFRGVGGLTIADTPAAFGAALLSALQDRFLSVPTDDPTLAPLLWESTVAPLAGMLREIGASRMSRSSPPRVEQCHQPS